MQYRTDCFHSFGCHRAAQPSMLSGEWLSATPFDMSIWAFTGSTGQFDGIQGGSEVWLSCAASYTPQELCRWINPS